ncbi:MAG: glycosyltransferase family 4 protein [Bacteroidota bacterium]
MKIGIEAQHLFREKKYGREMFILELIKSLQTIDTKNDYVIFVKPGMDNACVQKTLSFKIVEVKGSPPAYWDQMALNRAVKNEGCDVLHCTSGTAPLRCTLPLILNVNEYPGKHAPVWFRTRLQKKIHSLYERWNIPLAIKKAHRIIVPNKHGLNTIEKHFKNRVKETSIIYNGTAKHFRKIDDRKHLEAIRRKYKLPGKFLMCFGSVDKQKNLKNLLLGYSVYLSKNKDIPLVIVDLTKNDLNRILKKIGKPELKEQIHLTDYIINSDLPAIYNLCEVFLYPSRCEKLGLPVMEAMACRAPVLTSKTSAMAEIAGDAAYLADPDDPEKISLGIYRLISNKSLRNKNQEKGLQRAAKFNWLDTARNYIKEYEAAGKSS